MDQSELMLAARAIAREAATEIMQVYNQASGFDVNMKADQSPVTEADIRANAVIEQALQALTPEIPVLTEESASAPWRVRSAWQQYWLIDPLDGTREFISRNGEFTVNIALVSQGIPVLGVVHVPVTGVCYSACKTAGAWRQNEQGQETQIFCSPWPEPGSDNSLRVVASRRHGGEQLQILLQQLQLLYPHTELLNMGSSLKFCLLAEGKADFYPRLAPTCEWDTAAAHAILRAAGGEIFTMDCEPLRYNTKESLLNPDFIAMAAADPSHLQSILGSA